MSAPRWARALLARLAGPTLADEVLGDLEEAHRRRMQRRSRALAELLTGLEAIDMAVALLRHRRRSRRAAVRSQGRTGAALRHRLPGISWIDVKLGARMLARHPMLTAVSTIGMAVAVGIGASVFAVIHGITSPSLPLDEGDRVVAIQNVGALGLEQAPTTHLHDLQSWRDLPGIGDLAAYRIVTRNLITDDGGITPAAVVEMTASGFRIARVPPLLGRHLVDADEEDGTPATVVIGHGFWQERFGGRPDIIGRSIRVGGTSHTVVGVMPPEFALPINNRVWVPLRLNPTHFEFGKAPAIEVFGRLARGATLDEVAAQLATVGQRAAAAHPETHEHLRPWVFPYTQVLLGPWMAWVLYGAQALVSMLLVVVAINVAALVYARTVTRSGEIAVRTALGASRLRIAAQLFVEAFLLSAIAAVLGLVAARLVVSRIELYVRNNGGEQTPFWWHFGLSPAVLAYALGLAVVAAVIIGVFPALSATSRRLPAHLKSGGSGAPLADLGWKWTGLIVTQVAIAVAIMPLGLSSATKWIEARGQQTSRAALANVFIARLELDSAAPVGQPLPSSGASARLPSQGEARRPQVDARERYTASRDELVRRLRDQPEVTHVATYDTAPWEDPDLPFEVEGGSAAAKTGILLKSASTGHRVGRSRVSPEFLAAFGVPVLAGRALDTADALPEPTAVLVNETFVDLVLGGASPLGRRIRFLQAGAPSWEPTPNAPWMTVVGVVSNFMPSVISNPEARVYLAMANDERAPTGLAVRVRADAAGSFAMRARRIAVDVDPALRLDGLESVYARLGAGAGLARLFVAALAVLSVAVLLLAVASLYALMSFTVVRRHREIGIRLALGARPHGVLCGVLARATGQLSIGIGVGLALAGATDRVLAAGEILSGREALILPAVILVITAAGILAAWGPTRRVLAIQPSDALRSA